MIMDMAGWDDLLRELCIATHNCAVCLNEDTGIVDCVPKCRMGAVMQGNCAAMPAYGDKTNQELFWIAAEYGFGSAVIMDGEGPISLRFWRRCF